MQQGICETTKRKSSITRHNYFLIIYIILYFILYFVIIKKVI